MKKVLFMLLVMFALSACQSKDSYVKEFSDFVDKVEMEAADYTDKDWKKADLKFSDLSTDLYAKFEEELNADEKAEIIKLQATYAGLKMKAGVKDAAKKVDKFLDGLKEGTKYENKMNRNWVYSLFALWIVCSFACTQPKPVANVEVQKENFVFSIKGTDTLSLDKYELTSMSPASKKPVMIFAFGGGFKGGDKADKGYIPYFEFLARNGFVVVSTDYRTTLKNLDPSKVSSPMDFIAALQHAIDTAVEDFYDATGFVINQSSDWNIDVEQIVASGSSAGAITVLQAEYDLCNGHELAKRLPAGFNYAGVISYAGAVSGVLPPHWEKMPCPIMLFHGDADKTVPFEQAAMENLGGLWGSSAVAKSLENLQASYYFYKVENAGHEISGLPMSRNQYDIMSFLSRQVLGDENLAITTDERVPGDTIVRKDFTVQDYILDNLR